MSKKCIPKREAKRIVRKIKSGRRIEDISIETGYSAAAIRNALVKEDLKEALKLMAQGKAYLFEVRKRHCLSPQTFCDNIYKWGLGAIFQKEKELTEDVFKEIKKSVKGEEDDINRRAWQGEGYSQIARELGYKDRQYVAQHIMGSGQYQIWKRMNVQRRYQELQRIQSAAPALMRLESRLRSCLLEKSKIKDDDGLEDKAQKAVIHYVLSSEKPSITIKNIPALTRLFYEYHLGIQEGVPNIQQIARKAGFSYMNAYITLKKAGLIKASR